MTSLTTEYCAASSDDAEGFQKVIAPNWWDSAIEYANTTTDEMLKWAIVNPVDRNTITVSVGHARDPVRPSEIFYKQVSPDDFFRFITVDNEDYQIEQAEGWQPAEPNPNEKMKSDLDIMMARIADVIRDFEEAGGKPTWFIVETAQDVTLGLAESAAKAAALIDLTGKLQRHPWDQSLWLELDSPEAMELGHAQELRVFDIWAATQFCGIPFAEKPKHWRLGR